jgi:hypothetical protein
VSDIFDTNIQSKRTSLRAVIAEKQQKKVAAAAEARSSAEKERNSKVRLYGLST